MFDTLRGRLTLWYSVVLALLLLVFSLTSYFLFARGENRRTDADLAELAKSFLVTFQDELKDPDQPGRLQDAARQAMLEHRVRGDTLLVVDSAGKIVANSADVVPSSAPANPIAARVLPSSGFQQFVEAALRSDAAYQNIAAEKGGLRAYAVRFAANGQTWMLVILRSLHAQHEMLEEIRVAFAWLIALGVLLAGVGGYFLARRSLAPVAAMSAQAERISAVNLHDRLAVRSRSDELGSLAQSFNDLLDRLEQSFERQRRFISDASHELRTPVSILRGEAEVALSQASRSPEEYRESLAVLHQEAQRLARIVEDLFTLTRADAGEYRLAHSDFYLDELVADCVRAARALAQVKNIALVVVTSEEMAVRADEELLRRMILNLLDNAIKYTPVGGNISVACGCVSDGCEVSVTDSGPGIPADMQSRIFERFFRVDRARARSGVDGGAGLGLSIARWIAEAHLGRIDLVRSDATGSTFTVRVPVSSERSPSVDPLR
jgi:two-component system OmpR family sensor kinase